MKKILSNVQHKTDKTDNRDIEKVWISFGNNLKDIDIFNQRIYNIFENTHDEFEKLDILFKVLEEKEYLTIEENESYKEVRIQINILKEKFLEADKDRSNKVLIEKDFKKDFNYLEGYFDTILEVDYRNILGLKGTVEDLI